MVTVYFHEGDPQSFATATGAVNRGPVFTVHRYDTRKRDVVEVRSFLTEHVAYALVDEHSRPTQYVAGSTRRSTT